MSFAIRGISLLSIGIDINIIKKKVIIPNRITRKADKLYDSFKLKNLTQGYKE